ncbi:MAG: hypothetical protein KC613_04555 [Myxococcales bacterium]|nr:hypothetical protein [Myxococcales bacterium]
MPSPTLILLALLGLPGVALALPQFSVRSARRCDTCHVDPKGWEDPQMSERKCSLDCGTCHVSPSGGGMRTASGLYFQSKALPMWGTLRSGAGYRIDALTHLWSNPQRGDQITLAASQPTVAESDRQVPAPGTAARYDGLQPHPDVAVGASLRLAYVDTADDGRAASVFPMQSDLQLAVRPYNPPGLNGGRLTLLVDAGFQGSRGEEFDGFADRAFVREWWAMFHDLPNQLYARAGRFLPNHGWRLADHTTFTRSGQGIFGQPFDFERQVTGVEVGINPNYLYVHASVFNAADQWDQPIDPDGGFGGALAFGWRDLAWQVGGSVLGGQRSFQGADGEVDAWLLAYSLQWALNLEVWWPRVPLIYLGELHANHRFDAQDDTLGLSAFHELSWLFTQGLVARAGYTWADPSTRFAYDTRHRAHLELAFYPIEFLEVIVQGRHHWAHTDDRFELAGDELLLQLHAYY